MKYCSSGFINALFVLIIADIVDMLTTILALHSGELFEANPLMYNDIVYILKFILPPLWTLLIYKYYKPLALFVAWLFALIFCIAAINNVIWLITIIR